MKAIKVAIVQAAPVMYDATKTLERVEEYVSEAAGKGVDLVLFPESFIPAYPRSESFGAVVGNRSAQGKARWQAYWEASVDAPGPITERLGEIAAQHSLYLVIGVTERSQTGHTLFCTLLYFSPKGKMCGKHRKIKPTGSERIIWGEGKGDDLEVLTTPIGRVGGLICWENYMPLARMTLYRQGVEIYLAPTADDRDSWQATLRHIACEGRCVVLGANQFVRPQDYPDAWKPQDEAIARCRGGSAIVDPLGNYLAGPLFDKEGLLIAEFDPAILIRAGMDFDVDGHYQRPDLFHFSWKRPLAPES